MLYVLVIPGFILWFFLCAIVGLPPLVGGLAAGGLVWWLAQYIEKQGAEKTTKQPEKAPPTTSQETGKADSAFSFLQETIARLASEDCHPRDIDGIMHSLSTRHFDRSALLRNLQIWRESLTLAINSKNRETAESRMATAEQMFDESMATYSRLMTEETKAGLAFVMNESRRIFHTETYLNQARAHLEKASQMKTAKAKAKYVGLAADAIARGLADPQSDQDRLETFRGARFAH